MNSEVRVGLLFFVGIALAIWFTFFTTGIGRAKAEYEVRFRRISQLKDGDPVEYNGVRVGTVSEIRPAVEKGSPMVRVGFTVDRTFKDTVLVGKDTHYRIDLEVLGGARLAIVSQGGSPISYQATATAMGEEPTGIPETVTSAHDLIEENRPQLHELIVAFTAASKRVAEMSEQARDLIKENRQQVNVALSSVTETANQISGTVKENRTMVAQVLSHFDEAVKQVRDLVEENRANIRDTIGKAPMAAKSFIDAADRIANMIQDNRENLKKAIAEFAEFAPHLTHVGENLEVVSTQIAEGKGTIGKLVFEDTLHERATAAANSVQQRMEEIKPVTGSLTELKFFAGLEGGGDADTNVGFAEAYLRVEPRPWKFYEGGVSYRTAPADRKPLAEDPDKLHVDFNLMFGWRFFPDDDAQVYHVTVAGGLIESEIGARIEVPIWGQHLRGVGIVRHKHNDRDPLDRRFEDGSVYARAQLEYRPFLRYGIWAVAGVNDIVDHPDAWGGIRLELLDNDLRNLTAVSSFSR